MNFKQEEYLNMPIFDVIDYYFSTFEALCLCLYQYIAWCNGANVGNELERIDIFLVESDTLKKCIAIEINNNSNNPTIIKNYLNSRIESQKRV